MGSVEFVTVAGVVVAGRGEGGEAGGLNESEGHVGCLAGGGLDVAGLVRRARRVADLSQRDLAGVLGVCPSTVAHWETGRRLPDLALFEAVMRLAGLRLQVVVAEPVLASSVGSERGVEEQADLVGEEPGAQGGVRQGVPVDDFGGVLPMGRDGVRDGGGRRYPAHLDPEPWYQVWRPRWDRPQLDLCCHRRARRDRQRVRAGGAPLDHVTGGEVVATFAGWRAERAERIRLLMARRGPVAVGAAGAVGVGAAVGAAGAVAAAGVGVAGGSDDAAVGEAACRDIVGVAGVGVAEVEWCTCPIECEEGGPCPEGCPCGCEPRPSGP